MPVPGGPCEKEIVRSRSCDLERTASPLLPAYLGQVGHARRLELLVGERGERRRVYLAAEVRDRLSEVLDRNGLDARERRFGRGLGGADDALETGQASALRDRERARDRPDAPVEPELADGRVLREPLRRKLPRGGEHGERDREDRSPSPPCAALPERG